MALARTAPQKAIGEAARWEREGGDEGARHCSAVALLSSGAYAEAALKLESLAATSGNPDKALRAELFAQAGQAWLIAGDTERALAAQDRAIAIAGETHEMLIDRAIILAALGRYWDSIDDLNKVIDAGAERADVLVLRATAWRRLGNLELAGDDVGRALELEPDDPDALLERGNIHRLAGRDGEARADWQRLVERHPDTPAAEAARRNLERLDGN